MALYRQIAGSSVGIVQAFDAGAQSGGGSFQIPNLTGLITLEPTTQTIQVVSTPPAGQIANEVPIGIPIPQLVDSYQGSMTTPDVMVHPDTQTTTVTDVSTTPVTQPTAVTQPNGTTATVVPVTPAVQKPQIDWFEVGTIGALIYLALKGEKLFPRKRKAAFVIGLGALYYQYSKK